jgi:hypothetical protein
VALVQIDRNPSARNLQWFGVLLGLFLGLLGAIAYARFDWFRGAQALWIAAVALTLAYYAIPPLRKPLYLAWMYAAYPLGYVMSYVILGVLYFVLFAGVGLILRLLGRDLLQQKIDRHAATYWTNHRPAPSTSQYFRQF